MITSEQFFQELEDGQEDFSLFVGQEGYDKIPIEVREVMVINEIRKTNNKFKTDEVHKGLVKNLTKAKKELRHYEYDINNEQ